ncbi:MAG: thioredoxin-like domain-containing protein [Saprospiraceae bacterium]
MKNGLLVLLAFVISQTAPAQTTARATLSFQIEGLSNPTVTLGYYYAGKAYRVDSVKIDMATGKFSFQKEGLKPGLYFLTAGGSRLFDFMLASAADSFTVRGSMSRLADLAVENSNENTAYFAFESERKNLEEKIKASEQMIDMVGRATNGDEEALNPIQKDLAALYQSGDSLAIAFTKNYPSTLYAQMLLSVRPPTEDTGPQKLEPTLKGKPNPAFNRWQREHYFDHTDFGDERLLYNNFWHSFFDGFFARHVFPQPDSLIQAIDEVLRKMPRNGAFYRFSVLRLTQFFEQNEAPGADRVFVHLVDKYQKKDDTPWLDIATLERLAYKAEVHRPNLTGSLAVNFELQDETGKNHALYGLEAPVTMLVFYSPLCDHCKELMPKIYQTYLDYTSKGLKAIALNTDKQHVYWKKFVAQQGWQWINLASPKGLENLEKQFAAVNLPVIYLLDKDKRIVAKRIQPDKLGEALSRMTWK